MSMHNANLPPAYVPTETSRQQAMVSTAIDSVLYEVLAGDADAAYRQYTDIYEYGTLTQADFYRLAGHADLVPEEIPVGLKVLIEDDA